MKQEIIRLDQLTMGTIKYSDITLIQEKETEIISSDSLWRGIHEYYNGLVKSNIGNGKKVILQIHSKKEFILLFMALIRTGACPIILPVSMTKNSANMLQKICSDNQDAIIMADDMGKVCVQTLLPDIKLPLLSIKEFVCQDENIETDYNDFSDNIADDVAFVIYSSGSTSEPKGVMVTHKGVIRMLQETAKILGLTKEDVLLSWLPVEHMYPHRYYRVDDFPLNTNEKIDRKMLKSMADSGIQNKMHNEKQDDLRNPSLNKVIEIWSEVLNCDVEPENDFFELGGDSIKAQRIVRKIADNFKVKISFLTVIHSKNVAEFSKEVEKISLSFKNSKKDEATSAGSKQDNQNVFPLTGVQLAYLNGRNDNYELGKYNAHYYFEAETEYTANQIEYAIRKEVSRHDALRTIFYKNGRQKILNNVPDYSVIVTKCQNDEEKEIELQKQRKILSHKVYDHEKWPLFTFQMIESPNSRILMVSLDLMVCDGDSMQILFTEIADTLEGKSDAEKIEYSYAEYIQNISNQKNSESYEEDKAYWLNKIDSLSSYPQIPMKMKLADCRDYNIVRKSAIIDSVLWGNFKETARRHKVSPSALLCTLYGRIMAKWGNQSEVLLNLTVFQRQQKNTEKIIGDFTKLLPLNLVFAKEDIWKSAERVQEQIMKELDHLSFDGTEIMRELAKRRGVFGKALLPVVFTCVLFDCPENYFERLGSIKYAVSQTPQVFLDNQITEMGGRLHISWDVVDELFEACIIDEIFLEFVEDIKRISENNKANSTNDFVTKVWGNILTKEIITKSVVPDLLKNIDLKQIKILDYAQELCPPDVKGQVYVSESEIMNDRNKTYYKILEHPLYGRMADTGIIGVLTHDGYMEFVVPNCETSVETPDKKEDTHEEEIEKPIVKEIMKIWKEVFEIEDISIQDDFYTLGGDSIILMRLVDEMCKTLGCDVTVDDILQSENISDLANRV